MFSTLVLSVAGLDSSTERTHPQYCLSCKQPLKHALNFTARDQRWHIYQCRSPHSPRVTWSQTVGGRYAVLFVYYPGISEQSAQSLLLSSGPKPKCLTLFVGILILLGPLGLCTKTTSPVPCPALPCPFESHMLSCPVWPQPINLLYMSSLQSVNSFAPSQGPNAFWPLSIIPLNPPSRASL